jgi:hypothetical protein
MQRSHDSPAPGIDGTAAPGLLGRIVAARAPRERDLSIGAQVQGLAVSVRGAETGLAAAAKAWATGVPAHLACAGVVEGLSRGVLRVRVADAAARFELDRFLRAGGESAIIRLSVAPIRSVRLLA